MNKIELLTEIVMKQDELIEWLDSDLESGDALIRMQLSDLKKQLAECKEDVNFTKDDIDLAYCAGIWNTGGIDVLRKELERLKHIGRKPHQIFQRYKPIKTE